MWRIVAVWLRGGGARDREEVGGSSLRSQLSARLSGNARVVFLL